MQIVVKMLEGWTTTLEVEVSDTLRNVKAQIEDKKGVLSSRQCLTAAGEALEDSRSLLHYGIASDSTLDLVLADVIHVFVQLLSGKTVALDAEAGDTISSVKVRLQMQESLPVDHQHLIYESRELENDETLSNCGVQNESVLQLVLSIPRFEILLKPLRREPFTLEVAASDSIGSVKAILLQRVGERAGQVKLIFKGKVLEDGHSISHYGIQKDSFLVMLTVPTRSDHGVQEASGET